MKMSRMQPLVSGTYSLIKEVRQYDYTQGKTGYTVREMQNTRGEGPRH